MVETPFDLNQTYTSFGQSDPGALPREFKIFLVEAVEYDETGELRIEGVARDDLSNGFRSVLGLARTTGWELSSFDRQLAAFMANSPTADKQPDVTEISMAWKELGEGLGFDSLLDNLAIIWSEPDHNFQWRERLLEQVRSLVKELVSQGHPHAAVAVVASELPRELEHAIFEAGAQVIDVPAEFNYLTYDRRRLFLRSLFELVEPNSAPAPAYQNQEADRSQYFARHPDLTENEVECWWHRLSDRLSEG